MFFIVSLLIIGFGPLYNEGGYQAVEAKGAKAALVQAVEEREPYDSGSLKKDKLGNFGND